MKLGICGVLLVLAFATPGAAIAADWSSEFQYGRYYPELAQWQEYYGRDRAPYMNLSAGYRWFSFLEFGVDAGRMHDKGRAFLPSSGTTAGTVELELYPVSAQVQLNLRFAPGQWLVPFAALGSTQVYYRQRIVGQNKATGRAAGNLQRIGVAFNMNILDNRGASYMRNSYGISHTQLLLERRKLSVKAADVDLGGDMTLLGLRFEF